MMLIVVVPAIANRPALGQGRPQLAQPAPPATWPSPQAQTHEPQNPAAHPSLLTPSLPSPSELPRSPPASSLLSPSPTSPSSTPSPSPSLPALSIDSLCSWTFFSLPDDMIQPFLYDLNLEVVKPSKNEALNATQIVNGHVGIHLNVTQPQSCLVLHSFGINITAISYTYSTNVVKGHVHSSNSTNQQTILKFDEPIHQTAAGGSSGNRHGDSPSAIQGDLIVHLDFNYPLAEGLDGLYESRYKDEGGVERSMVVTQFEALAARKAFPCFDEPHFKAHFNVSVLTDHPVVLSNMPELSALTTNSTLSSTPAMLHTFEVTPLMSTYLLAIVMGNLVSVEMECSVTDGIVGSTAKNVLIKSWSTSYSRKNYLSTSLNISCSALQTYSSLLQMPYMLPKLELVGIPSFSAGAMENWGLITFKESMLLIDTSQDDLLQAMAVTTVVCHEVAHQWFGNLITPRDWTELWLKEGFATYLENVGAYMYKPQWGMQDLFYPDVTTSALVEDSLASAHPLSQLRSMETLAEVDSMYNSLSYNKGAAILMMLDNYLALSATQPGISPFVKALSAFLKQFQYSSVTYNDLWTSFSNTTGLNLTSMMELWTLHPNYPVLEVTMDVKASIKGYSVFVELVQRPLLVATTPAPCNDNGEHGSWWTPVAMRHEGKARPYPDAAVSLSSCKSHSFVGNFTGSSPPPYVVVNAGRYGYYRVLYSNTMLAGFIRDAPFANLVPALDMAGLLEDTFQFSLLGQFDTWAANSNVFMQLVSGQARRKVVEYAPWAVTVSALSRLSIMLRTAAAPSAVNSTLRYGFSAQTCYAALTKYIREKVTGPIIQDLAIPGQSKPGLMFSVNPYDNTQLRLLRPLLLTAAGAAGATQQLEQATELLLNASVSSGSTAFTSDQEGWVSLIPADLRATVYALSVMSGNTSAYGIIKSLYLQRSNAAEHPRLLKALAAVSSADAVNSTLQFLKSPAGCQLQDVGSLLSALALQGGEPYFASWRFLIEDGGMEVLLARYPNGSGVTFSLGNELSSMLELVQDDQLLERIKDFAERFAEILEPYFVQAATEKKANFEAWMKGPAYKLCLWLQPELMTDD
ncbi:hypothetical protein CEUSTIGMA_g13554.t1 [Chlamydomonas eustigma]|uniref:Alpha-aminoacylpeptide hydrolase n=1 Tax=Chlamydomonas eustigma TaxID=1157962 RepID=A0A250XSS3_9CHLO|nr:hypothetical protein CEUSTIGMA_g13554.t1 [Chlamydomonas eustigma]|eukprot:GAX86141.1 hypothetical protein CEUSTIGMA_g13554.t1 [Chlamydomonas eustigma]